MSCIPHLSVFSDGEEADDIIASFINQSGINNSIPNTILYSTDRDMWQLIGDFKLLKIFLDGDGNQPSFDKMIKKFSTVDFNKIVLHKIIKGDDGDNIKGVKNFQFKKSIQAFLDCDGTIEDYLELVPIRF